MLLINSPSPGASLDTWNAFLRKLKTLPSSDRNVRLEIGRAEKMIEMLSSPKPRLTATELSDMFKK